MAGGDAVGPDSARCNMQGLPPSLACSSLEVAALFDEDSGAPEWDAQRVSKRLGNIEVRSALGAEPMVDPMRK
jgi:hypothetical protein